MSEQERIIVEIEPSEARGETAKLIKEDARRYLLRAIKEDGNDHFLASRELELDFDYVEPIPTEAITVILVTLASQAAIEYWKYHLRKKLEDRYTTVTIKMKHPE